MHKNAAFCGNGIMNCILCQYFAEREEGVLISVEAGPRSAHLVHIPFMPYYKRVPRPARFPAWQFSSSTIDILSLDVDYRDKSLYFFDRDSRLVTSRAHALYTPD